MKESQEMQVLKHIQDHGKITALDAFREYSILRLSGRIHDLRHRGYEIETNMVSRNGKHYAEYTLKGAEQ